MSIKRTGLKRPTLEQVIAFETKQRQNRRVKPIPRKGRKAKREDAAWMACRALVITRSRGECEGKVPNVCPPYRHGATQVHHIWPEDRDAGRHDPDRCLHLCTKVHDWAHANPFESAIAGILRPDRKQE